MSRAMAAGVARLCPDAGLTRAGFSEVSVEPALAGLVMRFTAALVA